MWNVIYDLEVKYLRHLIVFSFWYISAMFMKKTNQLNIIYIMKQWPENIDVNVTYINFDILCAFSVSDFPTWVTLTSPKVQLRELDMPVSNRSNSRVASRLYVNVDKQTNSRSRLWLLSQILGYIESGNDYDPSEGNYWMVKINHKQSQQISQQKICFFLLNVTSSRVTKLE